MPSTHGPMSSKSRTLLYDACFGALYGALMFALKMAMASLPNIEPVTLLVLVAGCCLGKKGFLAICVYIVCELLVWGAGVWNMGYVLVWPLLFDVAYACRRIRSIWFWSLLAGVFGFSFGLWFALIFGLFNGVSAAFSWWVAGLPFDLVHGVAKMVVTFFLFLPLRGLCKRFDRRAPAGRR